MTTVTVGLDDPGLDGLVPREGALVHFRLSRARENGDRYITSEKWTMIIDADGTGTTEVPDYVTGVGVLIDSSASGLGAQVAVAGYPTGTISLVALINGYQVDPSTLLPLPAGSTALELIAGVQATANAATAAAADATATAGAATDAVAGAVSDAGDAKTAAAAAVEAASNAEPAGLSDQTKTDLNTTIDASVAEGVAPKLDAAVAAATYSRPVRASRTIVLGDSVDAFTNGWFVYLCILSGQKVTYTANAGVSGNKTSQMLARVQTDVIAYAPDVCIVGEGINDISTGVSEADTQANTIAIVAALRAAGIAVVFRNAPPSDVAGSVAPWNTVASRRAAIQRYNTWLAQYAASQGIPVLDMYTPLVDPATGGYLTGKDRGDGLHPNEQAGKDVAAAMITAGLPSVFHGNMQLGTSVAENSNYVTNSVFIGDSNADGGANSWQIAAATVRSLAAATAPAIGQVQHIEGDGTGLTNMYQDATDPNGVMTAAQVAAALSGHRIEMVARLKLISGAIQFRCQVTGGSQSIGPLAVPFEGIIRAEHRVPASSTQIRPNFLASTGVAPKYEVAQVAVRDLGTY